MIKDKNHFYNKSQKLRGSIDFELIFNTEKAIFKRKDVLFKNSDEEFHHNFAYPLLTVGSAYYYDSKVNVLFREGLKIKYPKNLYKWKFSGRTKMILKHKCYEAVAILKRYDYVRDIEVTYKAVVWFTKDIKVKWGPFGLINLPGLVLEGSNDGKITFRAVRISKTNKFPKKPKFSEEKTYMNFFKEMDEFYKSKH